MDKKLIDAILDLNLITNINVDLESCKDVDELIDKGFITVPGAKTKIMELVNSRGIEVIDVNPEPVIEVLIDEKPIDDTPTTELNVVDDTPETIEPTVLEIPEAETPIVDEPEAATVLEVEETVEVVETKKPAKKSKKTE